MTLMLKPNPKFSRDRKPNTILKQTGENHCNGKWCEWYYDGRSYERAILPYEVLSLLSQYNVKPDPIDKPGFWADRYCERIDAETKAMREHRLGLRGES